MEATAMIACQCTAGVAATPEEMAPVTRWTAAKFRGADDSGATEPLVSFVYGGKPFAELCRSWQRDYASHEIDEQRTEHTVTYTDPATGLVVRCVGTEFHDFPAIEWVAHFTNTGTQDTPILEDIQALDAVLPLPGVGSAVLHGAKGGVASFEDFAPLRLPLDAGGKQRLAGDEGRSSSKVLPFFNLERPDGGAVVAVGWTGNWAAEFANTDHGVAVRAGMAHTHFLLHPGESVRSPRMLVLTYRGDRWRGQNLLRRFILVHHRPTLNGKPFVAPITWGNWGGTSGLVHLDNIRQFIDHEWPIDYYWIDAGWYGKNGVAGQWWAEVGNWTQDQDLYPGGFEVLSRELRENSRRLMVWFEPERVRKDSDWFREHHDWLIDIGQDNCLFDLGNPTAREFLIDFISARIRQYGLGCYRQDFNMDPLPFWQAADTPDRQGMSEIRYIEGLYAFWDGLLARHPDLWIDNCASGGRRLDLETVGRATPFWRTDGPRDAVAHQCHTYGLMAWIPLSATSQDLEGNDYEFRSSISSGLCINWDHQGDRPQKPLYPEFPFAWGKQVLDQYVALRHLYYGDYYALTPWTADRTQWLAWQFDRPETGEGMVQIFRRKDSQYESMRLHLHGLDPAATYVFTSLDNASETRASGQELMQHGLSVAINTQPVAVLLTYRKAR
jgi:alpha-galactosidase